MSAIQTVRRDAGPQVSWKADVVVDGAPRARILSAAAELFCRQGFAATGVDAIVARAGTAKTTLYKHFESKELLIEAVLEREGAAWRNWLFGALEGAGGGPQEKILLLFDLLAEWFEDPDFYGCPFINAIGEFSNEDNAIRAAAAAHKAPLLEWLRRVLAEAGADDANEAARELVVLIDGAIVAAQASRDQSFARVAQRLALARLAAFAGAAQTEEAVSG